MSFAVTLGRLLVAARARALQQLRDLADAFWVLPATLVLVGVVGGEAAVQIERLGHVPDILLQRWLYSGGETGARTLLAAVATSSVTVAGTIFSITVAALSLASSQMGPRLLRNFTRDRGNQWTLGVLLAAFAYCLVVLRSVRGAEEGAFVPHLAVTLAIGLALACIGMMVFFVHHVATRINVDTVVDLVHGELEDAIQRLTVEKPRIAARTEAPEALDGEDAEEVAETRAGYLLSIDVEALADWAAQTDRVVEYLFRPGDFILPGEIVARVVPATALDAQQAVHAATVLGARRAGGGDLRQPIRQLVEVALRALSAGINDPMTAIGVIDRLGAALAVLAGRGLPQGAIARDGKVVVLRPTLSYAELVDEMFRLIRHSAAATPGVVERILSMLARAAALEGDPERLNVIRAEAGRMFAAARARVENAGELETLAIAHAAVLRAAGESARDGAHSVVIAPFGFDAR